MTSPSHQVLLYYKYVPIANAATYVEEHRALCQRLDLLGRIIIAEEGINGTVSGTFDATQQYIAEMQADPRFADMEFKIDPADSHVFPKLSIKLRDEIVSLHLGGDDIKPYDVTAPRLKPAEFLAAMQDPEVIVLDGRNNYESDLGRFKDAICPDLDNFRDFPAWIRENLADAKEKKILTYCTGGIRCEKLSGFLLKEGFKDVAQLHGGIVTYGKDENVKGRDFEGQCYVFDQRIAVEVNNTETRAVISTCKRCGDACERYVNCGWKPCNAQTFLCFSCEEKHGKFCSDEHQIALSEKNSEICEIIS